MGTAVFSINWLWWKLFTAIFCRRVSLASITLKQGARLVWLPKRSIWLLEFPRVGRASHITGYMAWRSHEISRDRGMRLRKAWEQIS